NQSLTVSYSNNTNAGIATAYASYPGDNNHNPSNASTTFTIDKANSVTTVTCPPGPYTYNGSAQEPCSASVTGAGGLNQSLTVNYSDNTDAGIATASASYPGDTNHNRSSDTQPFTIDKGNSVTTVTCPPGPYTYNGSAQEPCSASVTGAGGLNQSLTVNYSNNVDAGTATASASYAGDVNHTGSSDSKNFTIDKANQAITFGGLADKTFGDADFTVTATASSGLAVSFTASGNCTVTGNTVHITGAGSCSVTAHQGGNSNYNPAPDVPQSFNIAKADQAIGFGALADKTFGDADFNVGATGGGSGNPVTFTASGDCTGTGNTVHITAAGRCTIAAHQAGNANYNAAPDVSQSFSIAKANQLITFAALGDKTYGDADFNVSATGGGSGNPVTFAASGNCTFAGTTVH